MGREAFLERVWEWKAESGGTIIDQLKRLGASCDWSRERFTMDEGLSRGRARRCSSTSTRGLIYQDKRLVNWDPKFQTAISDLEVEQERDEGPSLAFRAIRSKDSRPRPSCRARPGPETMLGDTAVAVHPNDERYKASSARWSSCRWSAASSRSSPTNIADPEKGSGAVKITPAHDFNDFEVGKRHDLPLINILDGEAQSLLSATKRSWPGSRQPDLDAVLALHGVDRFDGAQAHRRDDGGARAARQDRADTPRRAARRPLGRGHRALADRPVVCRRQDTGRAGAGGRARRPNQFVPKNWEKTYFEWLENIEPWCVSRQLWWGHQIPAWYGPDGAVFVEETEAEAQAAAARATMAKTAAAPRRGRARHLVLLGLWPFSTLGWPDETPELEALLPDRRPGHRLRHHLLLGRPDDDDGPPLHGGGPLPDGLHPRPRP